MDNPINEQTRAHLRAVDELAAMVRAYSERQEAEIVRLQDMLRCVLFDSDLSHTCSISADIGGRRDRMDVPQNILDAIDVLRRNIDDPPAYEAAYDALLSLIRAYGEAQAAAQRERDAGIAETEADSASRIFGEARDAALNIAAAIRAQP